MLHNRMNSDDLWSLYWDYFLDKRQFLKAVKEYKETIGRNPEIESLDFIRWLNYQLFTVHRKF